MRFTAMELESSALQISSGSYQACRAWNHACYCGQVFEACGSFYRVMT